MKKLPALLGSTEAWSQEVSKEGKESSIISKQKSVSHPEKKSLFSSLLEDDSEEGHVLVKIISQLTTLPDPLPIIITNYYLTPLSQQEIDNRLAAADEARNMLIFHGLTIIQEEEYQKVIETKLDFSGLNISGLD